MNSKNEIDVEHPAGAVSGRELNEAHTDSPQIHERTAAITANALNMYFRQFGEVFNDKYVFEDNRMLRWQLDPVRRAVLVISQSQISDADLVEAATAALNQLYELACDHGCYWGLRDALNMVHVLDFDKALLPQFQFDVEYCGVVRDHKTWKIWTKWVGWKRTRLM